MGNFLNFKVPPDRKIDDDISVSEHNAILACLRSLKREILSNKLLNSADIGTKQTAGGITAWIKRRRGGGAASTVSAPCPFGEIITYSTGSESDSEDSKTGLRGGYLEAGKKVWEINPKELNLSEEGEWLVWIKVPVTANTDAGKKVSLAGLETSEAPTWETSPYDSDASVVSYGDKIIPPIFPGGEDSLGTAIAPIGRVKISGGTATLIRSGCGNIIIDHCPGKLSSRRGDVTLDSDSSTS